MRITPHILPKGASSMLTGVVAMILEVIVSYLFDFSNSNNIGKSEVEMV
jgi:hypothetical protein